jgi:hypothetical protein
LVGAPEHDIFDLLGFNAGALDRGLDRSGGEVVGPNARERAAIPPDRGTNGAHDPRFAHGAIEWPSHAGIVGLVQRRTEITQRSRMGG